MIRTIVVPDKKSISFDIPANYIGKQIEIIAFAKDEGTSTEQPAPKKASCTVLHADKKGITNLTGTKQMSDRAFADTNVLVYAHTDFDVYKQDAAQKLISGNQTIISTQVLQESANTLNKKFKYTWNDINNVLKDVIINNSLFDNNQDTVFQACKIAHQYVFSFYDSMIISPAISIKLISPPCTFIYTPIRFYECPQNL